VPPEPAAYVTVTDAAGRVLFRRLATAAEVEEAIQIAKAADGEAESVLKRIAKDRDRVLAVQARRAQTDEVKKEPEPQIIEHPKPAAAAPIIEETDELPAFSSETDFPDFVDTSSSVPEQPKLNEETDAFTAFGDGDFNSLSWADEDKGK
jgi:hypothetical protein